MSTTPAKLIESARRLTAEQSDGHGNRWAVFEEDVESFIEQRIGTAVERSIRLPVSHEDADALHHLVRGGEPDIAGLMYSEDRTELPQVGLLALIAIGQRRLLSRRAANTLWSAYPFFADGTEVDARISEIGLHPNRAEATLRLDLEEGQTLIAFDALFFRHRARYLADQLRRFSITALAYQFGPTVAQEHVIDNPDTVRRMRAVEAFVKDNGHRSEESDGDTAIQNWPPKSPEDLEPIRIWTGSATYCLPSSNGPADDVSFQGKVVAVHPSYCSLFGVTFWRVDVIVRSPDDPRGTLPFYVSERLLSNDWRPTVGEYVEGTAWIQCRMVT